MGSRHSDIDIDYVARLARISLTDAERERFGAQLADILEYFKAIEHIDLEGVEPSAHPFEVDNVWDDDEPGPMLTTEQGLANAPAARLNQFQVPKVVEDA